MPVAMSLVIVAAWPIAMTDKPVQMKSVINNGVCMEYAVSESHELAYYSM